MLRHLGNIVLLKKNAGKMPALPSLPLADLLLRL